VRLDHLLSREPYEHLADRGKLASGLVRVGAGGAFELRGRVPETSTNLEGAFGPACCLVLRDRRCPWAAFRRFSPDLENCTVWPKHRVIDPCRPAVRPTDMDARAAQAVRTDHRQDAKGMRWMPWHQEPMKDVDGCDKPR
jgi:hypothetical protein